jgi:hypothetical protein
LMGFGGPNTSQDEAEMIVTQYVTALKGVPHWAVARACMRFASGQVTAQELGEKQFPLGFRPSSAQLAMVARKFVQPLMEEGAKLSALLAARPELSRDEKPPEESTAYIEAAMAEFMTRMKHAQGEEAVELAKVEARARAIIDRELKERMREYLDAGLEPPKGWRIASLPMMLKMGWRIDEVDGKRVLVK